MQPSEHVDAAPARAARQRIGGAFATVCGWHLAAVAGFFGWVLTRPAQVSTGGELSFTTSRWAIALLLGMLVVAPGLSIRFALACGLMVLLRRWWRQSGVVVGTVAALTSLVTVGTAVAIYTISHR